MDIQLALVKPTDLRAWDQGSQEELFFVPAISRVSERPTQRQTMAGKESDTREEISSQMYVICSTVIPPLPVVLGGTGTGVGPCAGARTE